MMSDMEKVGDMKRIDARPRDRFVLMAKEHLSREQVSRIRKKWEAHWGEDCPPLIVFDAGLDLGIIRAEGAA